MTVLDNKEVISCKVNLGFLYTNDDESDTFGYLNLSINPVSFIVLRRVTKLSNVRHLLVD